MIHDNGTGTHGLHESDMLQIHEMNGGAGILTLPDDVMIRSLVTVEELPCWALPPT
jgi:hypothetical protein